MMYLEVNLSKDIGEDLKQLKSFQRVKTDEVVGPTKRRLIQLLDDVLQLFTHSAVDYKQTVDIYI